MTKGGKRGIFLLHQRGRKIPLNLPLPKGEVNCRLLKGITSNLEKELHLSQDSIGRGFWVKAALANSDRYGIIKIVMFTVGILTMSDRSHRGVYTDASGPAIKECLTAIPDAQVLKYAIVPDEKELIIDKLVAWADQFGIDLILTTGGTGLAPRDVTPEATLAVIDRMAPGFTDAIRAATQSKTPHAMLSRAISGVRRRTLIINMPGSPRAVKEAMEVILPALPHAIETLRGEAKE